MIKLSKRGLILFLLLLLLPVAVSAQEVTLSAYSAQADDTTSQTTKIRKKVGLVLSGGGAKGVAHLGVIKAIEEAGIPIDYIAGTSMGAIVGGLYAIGYSVEDLEKYVANQNWTEIFLDDIPRENKLIPERERNDVFIFSLPIGQGGKILIPTGFLNDNNVLNMLNELTTGYHDSLSFDSLPIPFACVAYDLASGRDVALRSGSLPIAIRSSMSIPGVFKPVEIGQMMLIDGGISNNFPVDVVRAMGADVVIGVDLAEGAKPTDEISSVTDVVDQLTTFTGRDKYIKNRFDCELYIHPVIKPYGASSFSADAVKTLLERGREAGAAARDKLAEFRDRYNLAGVKRDSTGVVRYHYAYNEAVMVGKIEIKGVSEAAGRQLLRNLNIKDNSAIRPALLRQAVDQIRGTGLYTGVSYSLSSEYPYTLTIYAKEKSSRQLYLGVRFDTEEMTPSILLNTNMVYNKQYSAALNIRGRLSKNPYIRFSTSLGKMFLGRVELSYMYKFNDFDLNESGERLYNVQFGQNQVRLLFSSFKIRNLKNSFGVEYEHYFRHSYNLDTLIRNIAGLSFPRFLNYYVTSSYESLDDKYFPTKGLLFEAKFMLTTDNFVNYKDNSAPGALSFKYMQAVGVNRRVTLIPSLSGRSVYGDAPSVYKNFLGGSYGGRYLEHQIGFSGIANIENAPDKLAVAGLELRGRVYGKNYISLDGNYGLAAGKLKNIFKEKHYYGLALSWQMNTIAGPMELSLRRSNLGKTFIYFGIGKIF